MTRRIVNPRGNQFGMRVNSEREGLPKADERAVMYAQFSLYYGQGMSDLKIAETVGCSDKTVNRWRHRNGLNNIYNKFNEKKSPTL